MIFSCGDNKTQVWAELEKRLLASFANDPSHDQLSITTDSTDDKKGGAEGVEYVLASGCRSIRIEKWTAYNRMMLIFNLKRTHYKQDTNEKVLPLLAEIGSLHFTVNAILLVVSQLMLTISIVNQSRRWSNKNTRAVSSPRQRRPNFQHKS